MSSSFQTLIELCQEWLFQLPDAEATRTHIHARLSSEEQKKFQLGYFPAQNQIQLLLNFFTPAQLVELGVAYYGFNYDTDEPELLLSLANHNLIIPFQDCYGTTRGLVGRSILSDSDRKIQQLSKYKNTPFNKSHHLFGLNFAYFPILHLNKVILVEGQFDAIKAQCNGLPFTVAVGGSNLSIEQLNLLLRFTKNIYLMFDEDEAGAIGMERIIKLWKDRANFQILKLPTNEFKDLDEFIQFGGPAVKNWMETLL